MYDHIFETHAHYDDPCYAGRLQQVLEAERRQGVETIINCGFDMPSSRRSVELSALYPCVYAAVGVFPLEAQSVPPGWLEELRRLGTEPKVVALGEIGLDYHMGREDRAVQIQVFTRQMELAAELALPIQVHCREAEEDMIPLLKARKLRGTIHRFASSPQDGCAFLDMGMYLSMGCNITYPAFAHVLETVRTMPLNRLLLETDSPFLPPAWLAGQISTSHMIGAVAEAIAAARGDVSPQQVMDIARENARALFRKAFRLP